MLVSSISWAQFMINITHNNKLVPNVGPMVARHFQYPATNITTSMQHLTAWPRVEWKALCFLTNLAATGWLWVSWLTVQLCNSCGTASRATTTYYTRRRLRKRTLLEMGPWRSAGTCSSVKGWVVFPHSDSRRNNLRRRKWISWELWASLKWERWPQTPKEV